MPEVTLEHPSVPEQLSVSEPTLVTEPVPVFVAEDMRRHHAVRLAAAGIGVLLAGWLAALAAGLIGFAPLPQLGLPRAGHEQPAPLASPPRGRAADRAPGTGAGNAASSGRQPAQATASGGPVSSAGTSGAGTQAPAATSGGGGTSGSTTTQQGGTTAQGTTTQSGTTTRTNSGREPSYTPPASGQKSATPPRGKSTSSPGATTSSYAPGAANRPAR